MAENDVMSIFGYDVSDSNCHWLILSQWEIPDQCPNDWLMVYEAVCTASYSEQSCLYSLQSRAVMAINYVIDSSQCARAELTFSSWASCG